MKLSIVTICYNAESEIEKTILSVSKQLFKDYEYIIVDGKSNDKTMDIIERYSDNIDTIISEPDNGIYDAMNKGIDCARGKWTIFLNAGDYFYNDEVLLKLFTKLDIYKNIDVAYGQIVKEYKDERYLAIPFPLEYIGKFMPFGHPAAFVKTEILKLKKFDVRFKIAADYNLFYNLYSEKYRFLYIDQVISVFESENGVSNKLGFATIKETSIVNKSYKTRGYYLAILHFKISRLLKCILSKLNPNVVARLEKSNRRRDSHLVILSSKA